MKPSRPIIHLTNAVLLCAPLVSMAQQPPCLDSSGYETTEITVSGSRAKVPTLYFLNRSPIPTYRSETGTEAALSSEYPLGSPFFGLSHYQTEQRVKIGRYDHKQQCFTQVLGWVAKSHLLKGRYPLRVGEVVKRFPKLKSETPAGEQANSKALEQSMSETNRLFLRALSRPEFRFEPKKTPGVSESTDNLPAKMGGLGHLWRYVYAVEEIDQKLWYLLGSKSVLTDKTYISEIDDTLVQEAQQVLLGWIPQQQVSEWSSNVVLEPNTDEKAVRERVDEKRMATLYQKADQSSQILAQENQELWKSALDGQANDETPARFEPFGFVPDIARYFVKGYNDETGWYHVASVGSTEEQPMTDEQIRAFLGKLRQLTNHLRAVDVVFVVDHSTSMGNEIETVKEFFNQLSRKLGKAHRQGGSMLLDLPGKKQTAIETNLDIKVSFVLYEKKLIDITQRPRRLPNEQAVIEKEVKKTYLQGGTEDIHHALYSVINNSKYWRPYAHRAIIVITDEPGNIIRHKESDVHRSLEQALQSPRQTIQKLGGNPNQIDYRDYTQIWAIFADNHSAFKQFKGNIDSLTYSDRIVNITDFVNDSEQRQKIQARIYETIYDLQLSVTARLNQLAAQIIRNEQPSNTNSQTATGNQSTLLLDQAAIEHVKDQLGIEHRDFAALGALAFVEGYTPKRIIGHHYDTYREVVLIERRDLQALYKQAESFLQAFDQSFKGKGNSRVMIAVALLQAIAQVSGNDTLLDKLEEMTLSERRRYARRWLNQRQVKNQSLAELINLQDSLPISTGGLFGMMPKDIQSLPLAQILTERDQLALKIVCLKKILDGQTVPQDINQCRIHQGQKKDWNYTPAGSSNTYIYLPLELVP